MYVCISYDLIVFVVVLSALPSSIRVGAGGSVRLCGLLFFLFLKSHVTSPSTFLSLQVLSRHVANYSTFPCFVSRHPLVTSFGVPGSRGALAPTKGSMETTDMYLHSRRRPRQTKMQLAHRRVCGIPFISVCRCLANRHPWNISVFYTRGLNTRLPQPLLEDDTRHPKS